MAILDENTEFCDAVDVSAAAGTALVGDVIDLGASGVNPGRGEPLYLVINVANTFTSGGSATVQFVLASDAQAAIATDGTATQHFLTEVFGYADLVAGTQIIVPLPSGRLYERYLGILTTTATATTTAGAIDAFLTHTPDNWYAYPDAVN